MPSRSHLHAVPVFLLLIIAIGPGYGMLGVSVVLWCPGEWAEDEKIKGQYAVPPEIQRDIRLLTAAHIKIMVGLFRKNTLYANPLDPEAFANYCA